VKTILLSLLKLSKPHIMNQQVLNIVDLEVGNTFMLEGESSRVFYTYLGFTLTRGIMYGIASNETVSGRILDTCIESTSGKDFLTKLQVFEFDTKVIKGR
jgi:hypothetical protein